jgi:predicted DCC family thiol-disulfide oxidoreductase YuxK
MRQPELTLLYDGTCPICAWEKRKLARSDKHGHLDFINIHAADFNASVYGVSMQDLMGRLHAITADGRLIQGVDTLLQSYRAVGWWWIYLALAIIPRLLMERAYGCFADHRYALSKRVAWLLPPACEDKSCRKRE